MAACAFTSSNRKADQPKHEQNGGDYPQNVQGKSEPGKDHYQYKGQKNEHDISISFLVAIGLPQSGIPKTIRERSGAPPLVRLAPGAGCAIQPTTRRCALG